MDRLYIHKHVRSVPKMEVRHTYVSSMYGLWIWGSAPPKTTERKLQHLQIRYRTNPLVICDLTVPRQIAGGIFAGRLNRKLVDLFIHKRNINESALYYPVFFGEINYIESLGEMRRHRTG